MNAEVVIMGTGAHARKLWLYTELMGLKVRAFIDDDFEAISPSPNIPCLHSNDLVDFPVGQLFLVAIGNPAVRKVFQEKFLNKGWIPIVLIHPSAYVAKDASIGLGSVVCANAVVETGSIIGGATIIDIGVLVDHDCIVGDFCHLKPGCILPANMKIGDGIVLAACRT